MARGLPSSVQAVRRLLDVHGDQATAARHLRTLSDRARVQGRTMLAGELRAAALDVLAAESPEVCVELLDRIVARHFAPVPTS